jgi:hypothetical protein
MFPTAISPRQMSHVLLSTAADCGRSTTTSTAGAILKEWFLKTYPQYKPNVLPPTDGKWNFTLVSGGSALNFHMEEE